MDVGFMYVGIFENKIDDKGRITIPSAFRKQEKEDCKMFFVITFIDGETLILASSEGWSPELVLGSATLPPNKINSFLRYITLNSGLVEVDTQGRITIPKSILNKLSFSKDCMIVGNVHTFSILEKSKFLAEKEQTFNECEEFLRTEEGLGFKRQLLPF